MRTLLIFSCLACAACSSGRGGGERAPEPAADAAQSPSDTASEREEVSSRGILGALDSAGLTSPMEGGGVLGGPSSQVGAPQPGSLAHQLSGEDRDLRYGSGERPEPGAVRVEIGEVEIEGGLDPAVARRRLLQSRPSIQRCWERAHRQRPELTEASVVLRLSVDAQGNVAQASILEGSPAPNVVSPCLPDHAARWRFPEAPAGLSIVSVPITLTLVQD